MKPNFLLDKMNSVEIASSMAVHEAEKRHGNIAFFIPHLGCPHQCSFCNQRSITGCEKPPSPAEVASVLEKALSQTADPAQTEVAFFGGSFTAIPRESMCAYLEAAAPFVKEGGFSGIRISTRPDAIDSGILRLLQQYRVTAVELGAQSMEDMVLTANRRGHTAESVRHASQMIRENGFQLGLQMMLGLDGDSPEGAIRTAEELALLHPATMRVYPTVVLRETPLAELYAGGEYQPMKLAEAVELGVQLLLYFGGQEIRVIRMGLHASKQLEEQRIAGPYHPAYKELCESRIYLRLAELAIERLSIQGRESREVTLFVNPRAISKMIGQRRENLITLRRLRGWKAAVKGKSDIPPYVVEACFSDSID